MLDKVNAGTCDRTHVYAAKGYLKREGKGREWKERGGRKKGELKRG